MPLFRKETPKRRNILTVVSNYSEHREDLKKDYKSRCGYCDDVDTWRIFWYELDHFVPKKYLKTIKETDYSNLVYSCRSCNNSKRAHWPTLDEKVHNRNNEGFIDPCDDNYDKQFSRTIDGRIKHETDLGEWMYYKLKLHKPQHEVIWQIESLDNLIEECERLLALIESDVLKDRVLNLYKQYRIYTKQISSL